MQEREQILRDAITLICKDRNNTYGEPTQDFDRTAKMWSVMFGREFAPHEVAMAMMALKLSRLSWDPTSRDGWADSAGYSGCGWECVTTYIKKEEKNEEATSGCIHGFQHPLHCIYCRSNTEPRRAEIRGGAGLLTRWASGDPHVQSEG